MPLAEPSDFIPSLDNTAKLARWGRDPLLFVREVLRVQPDPWQERVLSTLARGVTRISIRSGNGVGKTTLLAWLALWFPICRFPSKTVLTAPTSQQLFDALWSELRRWLGEAPLALQELLEVYNDRMHLKSAPEQVFVSARTSRAETPEAIQGVHSSNVLLIVDEASGVPEQVFEAGSGSMSTPGAITILAGNPLRSSGFFWRTHNDLAHSWASFRVSATESPRVDQGWVKEQADTYGLTSAYYQARVLGEFPMHEDEVLIPRALVVPACERALPQLSRSDYSSSIWGLDLARFGSASSVLLKRIGNSVPEPPSIWRATDLMHIVGAVKVDYEALPTDMRPTAICVDAIGMGAGVADRMLELGLPVIFVNVSESPAISGRYYRLRDELYGRARDWFEKRDCAIPRHERLVNELTSIRYRFTSDGRLRVESKDEMKKRGMASPDCFVAGTLVATPGGGVPIEDLRAGDVVLTPFGPSRVFAAHKTVTEQLTTVRFSNAAQLCGTGKHKIFCWGAGEKRLDALCLTDRVEPLSRWRIFWWGGLSVLSTAARCSGFKHLAGITRAAGRTSPSGFCIVACGLITTALFRATKKFIISTATGVTTTLATWLWWTSTPTAATTCCAVLPSPVPGSATSSISTARGWQPQCGTGQMPGVPGTGSMPPRACSTHARLWRWFASAATPATGRAGKRSPGGARKRVRWRSAISGLTPTARSVCGAATSFWRAVTTRASAVVPVRVLTKSVPPTPVYNLTLETHNAYYANDLLVYNCADSFALTFALGSDGAIGWGARVTRMQRSEVQEWVV